MIVMIPAKSLATLITNAVRDNDPIAGRAAEHSGDNTSQLSDCEFTIYPRAVND
jgi:hypothetical protein